MRAQVISAADAPLGEARCKAYAQGLLRGLAHVHKLNLVHRDVKPGNILLSTHGTVKLADFGLARANAAPGRGFSFQAATRWYRAPEMLYAARQYGAAVDMWGLGCVLAELLVLSPLLPGVTDIDQLRRVMELCGTPDVWEAEWPEARALPDYAKVSFAPMPAGCLATRLPGSSATAVALVDALLQACTGRRRRTNRPRTFVRDVVVTVSGPASLTALVAALNHSCHAQVPPLRRPSAAAALRDAWFVTEPLPSEPSACAHAPTAEV